MKWWPGRWEAPRPRKGELAELAESTALLTRLSEMARRFESFTLRKGQRPTEKFFYHFHITYLRVKSFHTFFSRFVRIGCFPQETKSL